MMIMMMMMVMMMMLLLLLLQEAGKQASSSDDVCVAVSAAQDVCRPGHQVPRPSTSVSHHRQVCHPQTNRSAGMCALFTADLELWQLQ